MLKTHKYNIQASKGSGNLGLVYENVKKSNNLNYRNDKDSHINTHIVQRDHVLLAVLHSNYGNDKDSHINTHVFEFFTFLYIFDK